MSRAVFHVGHLQAGAPLGRALLLVRGTPAPSSLRVTAVAAGYAFDRIVSAEPAATAMRRALAARDIAVFQIELSGPLPSADITLQAEAGGTVVARRSVRPIPAELGGGVSFVLASCLYPNPTFLETLASALERAVGPASNRGDWSLADPRFALLLGDNVYLDVHPDRVEGNGAEHTAARYAKAFIESDASARALSALPALSLVDDHELYDGYPEVEPHVMRTWLPHVRASFVDAAQDALRLFQTSKNPPGVGHSFRFEVGPLSFFGLDTRISRTRIRIEAPRLTSEADIAAMEDWARSLKAPGMLLLSQPLLSPKGSYIEPSYSSFKSDFARILRAVRDAPFDIAVLSGDLHTSRVVELDIGGRLVTEVVSSPMVRVPSFLKNLAHRVLGGAEDQEPEVIAIPETVDVPPDDVDIGCAAYVMGTAAPNTLALLNAKATGDDILIEVELVDHAADRLARCEPDRAGRSPRLALGLPCATSFRLSRRTLAPAKT
jgi:hypothetical protein